MRITMNLYTTYMILLLFPFFKHFSLFQPLKHCLKSARSYAQMSQAFSTHHLIVSGFFFSFSFDPTSFHFLQFSLQHNVQHTATQYKLCTFISACRNLSLSSTSASVSFILETSRSLFYTRRFKYHTTRPNLSYFMPNKFFQKVMVSKRIICVGIFLLSNMFSV